MSEALGASVSGARGSVQEVTARSNPLLLFYVITASAILHALIAPAWVLWLNKESDHEPEPLSVECAELVEESALIERPCRNERVCPAPSALEVQVAWVEPEEPEPRPEELEPVVVTPTDLEETEPPIEEDARAARVDHAVEKEQVARGDHYGTSGASTMSQAERARAALSGKPVPREREAPTLEEEEGPLPEEVPKEGDSKEEQPSEEPAVEGPEGLIPDFQEELLAAAVADGGSMDYLTDVEEGDRTYLNQRRVSYADFFERVKRSIASHWQPGTVYRRQDPTGKIYGVKDRLTVLHVTLNGDGSLAQLYVDEPSGVDFLDDEALRAMNLAVPFPNPPEGLKDLDGLVRFKFGFHVELSTKKFRVFRYR